MVDLFETFTWTCGNIQTREENSIQSKVVKAKSHICQRCPFTFDGAFGLTEAKHSLNLCRSDYIVHGNLVGHLMLEHKLQKACAHRLCQAILKSKDIISCKWFGDP